MKYFRNAHRKATAEGDDEQKVKNKKLIAIRRNKKSITDQRQGEKLILVARWTNHNNINNKYSNNNRHMNLSS